MTVATSPKPEGESAAKGTSTPSPTAIQTNNAWGLGHAVFLIGALFYVITYMSFAYKLALLGLSASLMVEVYRACMATEKTSTAEKLFLSESSPYLFLSLLMYILTPSFVLLLPMTIYSMLHLNSFCRINSLVTSHPWWRLYLIGPSEQLASLRATLLQLASHMELATFPYLIFSIFSTGITLPIVYASFLRWQYFVSPRMRDTVGMWDEVMTKAMEHPSCPKQVRKAYGNLQGMMKKWAKMTLPQQRNVKTK